MLSKSSIEKISQSFLAHAIDTMALLSSVRRTDALNILSRIRTLVMYLASFLFLSLCRIHSFFFYKNIFYKNIEAEICEILRIKPRLRF